MLDFLTGIIFPQNCLNCGKTTGNSAICGECFSGIPINQTLFCGKCGLRLAGNKKVCHKAFPYVLGAATNYDGAAKELIHVLKFKFVKGAADNLAELLIKYAEGLGTNLKNFTVVPIPLSGKRLRERGFNQSELIAEKFAARFGLQIEAGLLLRKKHGRAQSETGSAAEREENVLGAFAASNAPLSGKNIILIDDVITSGATMLEAAQTLKAAGAKRILALAVAWA